ncbi:MAG: hypothetical protein Q7R81_01015 [Candidatus Peregrinibacteria bacterium]|nr:hypothetical protein [Candidatus Peregrinibacteria bacterium]
MAKIVLVGEQHDDPFVSVHAQEVLRAEKPDAITLEHTSVDRIASAYQRIQFWELLSHHQEDPKQLEELVTQNCKKNGIYPAVAAIREYALANKIPLNYIGHPDQSNIERLIAFCDANIPLTVRRVPDPQTRPSAGNFANAFMYYRICRKRIAKGTFAGIPEIERPMTRTPTGEVRDVYSAQRIRELVAKGVQKLCHFGGMKHLLDDDRKETLYSLLKDEFDIDRIAIDHHSEGIMAALAKSCR